LIPQTVGRRTYSSVCAACRVNRTKCVPDGPAKPCKRCDILELVCVPISANSQIGTSWATKKADTTSDIIPGTKSRGVKNALARQRSQSRTEPTGQQTIKKSVAAPLEDSSGQPVGDQEPSGVPFGVNDEEPADQSDDEFDLSLDAGVGDLLSASGSDYEFDLPLDADQIPYPANPYLTVPCPHHFQRPTDLSRTQLIRKHMRIFHPTHTMCKGRPTCACANKYKHLLDEDRNLGRFCF
jgi:hypothetical protein